jgi:hypothetical protein
VKNPEDEPTHFVFHIQDVTECKEAEAALRRSEAYLADAQRMAYM